MSYSVLNVKSLLGAFNQEKALIGAFSVIVKTDCETNGSSAALVDSPLCPGDIHISQARAGRPLGNAPGCVDNFW